MGQVWERTSPRWAGAPPTRPKAQLGGERGNPRRRWAYRPTLGRAPSLPPLGRTLDGIGGSRTPWGGNPRGGAPPSLYPIYT